MSNLRRLPDKAQVERAASDWVVRLHADDVSKDERLAFEAWRNAHPLHARVYEEIRATWREFQDLGPLVRAVAFGESMNKAARGTHGRKGWLAAAVAIAAIVAVIGYYVGNRPQVSMFQTAIGEHASVSLPDGSTLDLNSNSFVRVEYSDRARVIRLDRGEAFFQVARDARRPFWVAGGGSLVRALGTAFFVYLRPDDVRITVSEGAIKVGTPLSSDERTPSDEVLAQSPASVLGVGQQIDLHGSTASLRTLSAEELSRSGTWRLGTVYFEDEALSEVAAELGRYSPVKIFIDDPALRQLRIGGTFKSSPQGVEAFLAMLRDGMRLKVRRDSCCAHILAGDAAVSR